MSFCYDFAGRVARKRQTVRGVELEVAYTHTRAGRLSTITLPDGAIIHYHYDAAGGVSSVERELPSGDLKVIVGNIEHTAFNSIKSWDAGARHVERVHDLYGRVTELSGGKTDGLNASLAWGREGHVSRISSGTEGLVLVYDGLGRLKSAASPTGTAHYSYDQAGNRTRKMSYGLSGITHEDYRYASESHRLMSVDTATPAYLALVNAPSAKSSPRTYDLAGNTTSIDRREFVYDDAGRMVQVKVDGIVGMNYVYSVSGQQVARYVAGETTVALYDEAGHWIGDYDGAGRAIRQIVWLGDLPVAVLEGERTLDIQPDHLGAPRVIVDSAEDKAIWAWSMTGEPFGSDAPNEDPDGNGVRYVFDMRFPGQRFDAVTGLFQNGWRDYDPSVGRYVQSDPIGLMGGIATYAYVASDPYTRIDPKGLDGMIVNFPNYMADTGFGFRLPLGHSGAVAINEVTGETHYFDIGRYGGKYGDVRGPHDVGTVRFDEHGQPTESSLLSVLGKISTDWGHGYTPVVTAYSKNADALSMWAFAMERQANISKYPYTINPFSGYPMNFCHKFAKDVFAAGMQK
ncbi:RHS repeat-associated core domain-containing protein [Luteibacter sp.]|uniref:RHS repeat-associated core domain-containing protein n=1 Tax=Luteibacter sp. TaxID=1886636 RepID=UPI002F3FCF35